LADFQDARQSRMERVEQLKHALRGVFADVNSAAEHFACRIQNNQLDVIAPVGQSESSGNFAEHGLVEKIVFRTIQGHFCDARIDAEIHMLKLAGLAPSFGVDRLNHLRCSSVRMPFLTREDDSKKPKPMLARRSVVATPSR